MNYRYVYYCCLGFMNQRSSQWAFFTVIFPFSKIEREGKRGLTNLVVTGLWVSIHVFSFYFGGAGRGRMMPIKLLKWPLLTYFWLVLALSGL